MVHAVISVFNDRKTTSIYLELNIICRILNWICTMEYRSKSSDHFIFFMHRLACGITHLTMSVGVGRIASTGKLPPACIFLSARLKHNQRSTLPIRTTFVWWTPDERCWRQSRFVGVRMPQECHNTQTTEQRNCEKKTRRQPTNERT